MDVFFSDEDRLAYLNLLVEHSEIHGITYLAWCLMTNPVHLVAIPVTGSSLAKGIGEAHKRYSRMVNLREGWRWRGYLFQGRFFSCPIGPSELVAVVRYVLRNPVRAGLADEAWGYLWSSARWLVGVGSTDSDPLVGDLGPLAEIDDWRATLTTADGAHTAIQQHTRTGRPLGDASFLSHIEELLDRRLKKRKPGPTATRWSLCPPNYVSQRTTSSGGFRAGTGGAMSVYPKLTAETS